MNQVMNVKITAEPGNRVVDLIAHGGTWWCVCVPEFQSPSGKTLYGVFRWHGDEVVWQLCVDGPKAVAEKFVHTWSGIDRSGDRSMTMMSDLEYIVSHVKAYV